MMAEYFDIFGYGDMDMSDNGDKKDTGDVEVDEPGIKFLGFDDEVQPDVDAARGGFVQDVPDSPYSTTSPIRIDSSQGSTHGGSVSEVGSLSASSNQSLHLPWSQQPNANLGSSQGHSGPIGLTGATVPVPTTVIATTNRRPTTFDISSPPQYHARHAGRQLPIPSPSTSGPSGPQGPTVTNRQKTASEDVIKGLQTKIQEKPTASSMEECQDTRPKGGGSVKTTKHDPSGSKTSVAKGDNTNAKQMRRRELGRLHAAKTRERAKKRLEDLQLKTKELEAIQEIYKKCISVQYRKLTGVYPNFTPHTIEWYPTSDGKIQPITVNCLLPTTDPQFLQELGNNPGPGFLNDLRCPSQEKMDQTAGTENLQQLPQMDQVATVPPNVKDEMIETVGGGGVVAKPFVTPEQQRKLQMPSCSFSKPSTLERGVSTSGYQNPLQYPPVPSLPSPSPNPSVTDPTDQNIIFSEAQVVAFMEFLKQNGGLKLELEDTSIKTPQPHQDIKHGQQRNQNSGIPKATPVFRVGSQRPVGQIQMPISRQPRNVAPVVVPEYVLPLNIPFTVVEPETPLEAMLQTDVADSVNGMPILNLSSMDLKCEDSNDSVDMEQM